ncbi:MAG: 4-alpha-glucanotransferase, partial [Acidimicrobiaceae bacterium]
MARDAWGIEDGYWDIAGRWHDTPEPTRRALRVAMGGLSDVADPPPTTRPVWFVRHGTSPAIERPAELMLEDGTVLSATTALPPDLPLGYHDLLPSDGGPTTRLVVAPDRCHLPA